MTARYHNVCDCIPSCLALANQLCTPSQTRARRGGCEWCRRPWQIIYHEPGAREWATTTTIGDARKREASCAAWRKVVDDGAQVGRRMEVRAAAIRCGGRDSTRDDDAKLGQKPQRGWSSWRQACRANRLLITVDGLMRLPRRIGAGDKGPSSTREAIPTSSSMT
jgi:hypothetical protein